MDSEKIEIVMCQVSLVGIESGLEREMFGVKFEVEEESLIVLC